MSSLITAIFYINLSKEEHSLNESIYIQMRICTFDLKCDKFQINFVKTDKDIYILHENKKGLYAYFPVLGAKENVLEVYFLQKDYIEALWKIKKQLLIEYIFIMIIVLLLAAGFSFFSLAPLRKSLHLTQEFVKDILHDFNTPLSTLRLNTSMLKRDVPSNDKLERIEKSVASVLDLQSHLRSYLSNDTGEKEHFNLFEPLQETLCLLEKNHPRLFFSLSGLDTELFTHKDAFMRIINNLLSNAVKYNKQQGSIHVIYHKQKKVLEIKDTGKGIKEPSKVFERFYKEQDRGIGIGLNIVKKLCEELNIKITVNSKLNEGTSFNLNIQKLLYTKV